MFLLPAGSVGCPLTLTIENVALYVQESEPKSMLVHVNEHDMVSDWVAWLNVMQFLLVDGSALTVSKPGMVTVQALSSLKSPDALVPATEETDLIVIAHGPMSLIERVPSGVLASHVLLLPLDDE